MSHSNLLPKLHPGFVSILVEGAIMTRLASQTRRELNEWREFVQAATEAAPDAIQRQRTATAGSTAHRGSG
jgi:hypothetical protein